MGSYKAPDSYGAFFIDEPVEMEIIDGIVRMRFKSAGRTFETRSTVHNMLVGMEICRRAHAAWERDQRNCVTPIEDKRASH